MPAYEADLAKFAELDAQVLGISVDHTPVLKAWAKEIGPISYPLLSDFWPHGATAISYGVLRNEGYSERAIFLIDKDGIIRYVDIHDIDDRPDNEVVLAELRKLEPETVQERSAPGPAASDTGRHPAPTAATVGPHVKMYCRSWCPDCRKARDWFERHNVAYTEIDVEASPSDADRVKEWTGGKLVTPTCDVDGTIIVDYDEERYESLLGVES